MDLALYSRVLWRFRFLVVGGVLLALFLAVSAYYKPGFKDGRPTLTHRQQELWQNQATVFLTQPGFPAGRTQYDVIIKKIGNQETPVPKYSDPARFTGLAGLYARLAGSDAVKQLMIKTGGPLNGVFTAIPTADTSYGGAVGLPMVTLFGKAATPGGATRLTQRGMTAFLQYLQQQQDAAAIPASQRVLTQVLNAPAKPLLVEPRKKTLPIFVFFAVVFATIALAFVFENARPSIRVVSAESGDGASISDVRRSA